MFYRKGVNENGDFWKTCRHLNVLEGCNMDCEQFYLTLMNSYYKIFCAFCKEIRRVSLCRYFHIPKLLRGFLMLSKADRGSTELFKEFRSIPVISELKM
jgi:hypothetical protein